MRSPSGSAQVRLAHVEAVSRSPLATHDDRSCELRRSRRLVRASSDEACCRVSRRTTSTLRATHPARHSRALHVRVSPWASSRRGDHRLTARASGPGSTRMARYRAMTPREAVMNLFKRKTNGRRAGRPGGAVAEERSQVQGHRAPRTADAAGCRPDPAASRPVLPATSGAGRSRRQRLRRRARPDIRARSGTRCPRTRISGRSSASDPTPFSTSSACGEPTTSSRASPTAMAVSSTGGRQRSRSCRRAETSARHAFGKVWPTCESSPSSGPWSSAPWSSPAVGRRPRRPRARPLPRRARRSLRSAAGSGGAASSGGALLVRATRP